MTIHPGQGCGPCHLCSPILLPLVHLGSRTFSQTQAIEESVTDDSCICQCEKDLKRKINLENYVPHTGIHREHRKHT